MDAQTKDEKEYLDPELFEFLQKVKAAIERGELDGDGEEEDGD